ncbi:putative tubulin binding cofactor A [Septoria linicola]|nr:putative tubulin binding cofactor A [Septoria linicola]
MPAPSQIAIATSALNRLVKEEKSYRGEYDSQKARIAKLEADQSNDENAEYILRQERKVLQETEAMFPQLKQKITEAKEKLEVQLEQDKGPGDQSNTPEDVTKAKEAIAAAQTAIRESS